MKLGEILLFGNCTKKKELVVFFGSLLFALQNWLDFDRG